ncbi:acyl carrier protein [Streptomyces niveus]|uniref:acyl carrier protein n=1 Tax=Streptomyces niveus TaxID=193462 RepID=UPI00343D440D
MSAEAAALLGCAPDGGIGPATDFLEAGMDSVTAAALRAATGLTLTTGAVCDHGTPARLATVLHEEFKRGGPDEHTEAVAADAPVALPVRLSGGPATRRLVYVPSPMALGGAHQYARFAAHLHDRRGVGVRPFPDSAVTSRCRCFRRCRERRASSRGRERRPATRPSSCWTPICRTTAGATTTCGVRCSRECRTARTASAGSAPHVWPP